MGPSCHKEARVRGVNHVLYNRIFGSDRRFPREMWLEGGYSPDPFKARHAIEQQQAIEEYAG
jgi:hypothetical protein